MRSKRHNQTDTVAEALAAAKTRGYRKIYDEALALEVELKARGLRIVKIPENQRRES